MSGMDMGSMDMAGWTWARWTWARTDMGGMEMSGMGMGSADMEQWSLGDAEGMRDHDMQHMDHHPDPAGMHHDDAR